MTKVFCGFQECIFCKEWDKENLEGVCTKDCIHLDNEIENIYVGCPDAEWEDEEEDD